MVASRFVCCEVAWMVGHSESVELGSTYLLCGRLGMGTLGIEVLYVF